MMRVRVFVLLCGLLALVFLVVHPDFDPLDFTADQAASHLNGPSQHQPDLPLRTAIAVSSHPVSGLLMVDQARDWSGSMTASLSGTLSFTVLRI
jgi:hypothetical protein